jgi:hypothetical protein
MDAASEEIVWRQMCPERHNKPHDMSWKDFFREMQCWSWSEMPTDKSHFISVESGGITAEREHSHGTNPCIRTTKGVTRYRRCFQVRVDSPGSWLSIGVSEPTFPLNMGKVCGSESPHCFNCGYYSDSKGNHYVKFNGEQMGTAKKIDAGDVVRLVITTITPSLSSPSTAASRRG